MGSQLYYPAWGIDLSKIGEPPTSKGQIIFGRSQILLRDYTDQEEIKHVILEICEKVSRQARKHKKAGRTVSLGIGYSKDENGEGFHRAKTIDYPTNIMMELYKTCLRIFDTFYQSNGKTDLRYLIKYRR
jgi:DNA polymerase V